jgi:uncharacterized membrane protein (UPF0182 family)
VLLNESDIPILKKIIVASGNKVAIGNNLKAALDNLLSQYAVNIEVSSDNEEKDLIESIIKANTNLTESNTNNDWEMIGKDLKKLQDLIKQLEQFIATQENQTNTVTNNTNIINNIMENAIGNNM